MKGQPQNQNYHNQVHVSSKGKGLRVEKKQIIPKENFEVVKKDQDLQQVIELKIEDPTCQKFDEDVKETMERSGISIKQTIELLSMQAGGRENLGYMDVDYKNHVHNERRMALRKGDGPAMMEYFHKMQLADPSYFYSIQVDDDALLYDETIESFKWLFENFLTALSGKQPRTILTDQSAAMAKAITEAFPKSNHRLCLWHIYQNAAKNLHHVFHSSKHFVNDFSDCLYEYEDEDEDEWLVSWDYMLKEYGLTDNKWLCSIFDVKENWAMVYGRHMFTAYMRST
ncbi:hypothetical protein SO802_029830 [Lithocarpus litseifolius]|uniref:MULE transposase domain-containing protein n=1 Tax=Lithocarpus litseifolius TaxID=425828 RepID=A0AAW2BW44_9ROSI